MTRVILDPRQDKAGLDYGVTIREMGTDMEIDFIGWYPTLEEALDAARAELTTEMVVADVLDCVQVVP